MNSSPPPLHADESPVDLERLRQRFPNWLKRFLPSGGGSHDDHHGKGMFGITVFLLSESIIFLSFFLTYILLRLNASEWLPPGVSGPEPSLFVVINTVILLSSSVVIQSAERSLTHNHQGRFRLLWSMTTVMGTYFLIGQGIEWSHLDFGLRTGLMGTTFYLLTGFHGLHVLSGVILQVIMLVRSGSLSRANPSTDNSDHFGVRATTLFWHFVDGIWVVLFLLLYIW